MQSRSASVHFDNRLFSCYARRDPFRLSRFCSASRLTCACVFCLFDWPKETEKKALLSFKYLMVRQPSSTLFSLSLSPILFFPPPRVKWCALMGPETVVGSTHGINPFTSATAASTNSSHAVLPSRVLFRIGMTQRPTLYIYGTANDPMSAELL